MKYYKRFNQKVRIETGPEEPLKLEVDIPKEPSITLRLDKKTRRRQTWIPLISAAVIAITSVIAVVVGSTIDMREQRRLFSAELDSAMLQHDEQIRITRLQQKITSNLQLLQDQDVDWQLRFHAIRELNQSGAIHIPRGRIPIVTRHPNFIEATDYLVGSLDIDLKKDLRVEFYIPSVWENSTSYSLNSINVLRKHAYDSIVNYDLQKHKINDTTCTLKGAEINQYRKYVESSFPEDSLNVFNALFLNVSIRINSPKLPMAESIEVRVFQSENEVEYFQFSDILISEGSERHLEINVCLTTKANL